MQPRAVPCFPLDTGCSRHGGSPAFSRPGSSRRRAGGRMAGRLTRELDQGAAGLV